MSEMLEVYNCDFLNVRKGPSTKYAVGAKIYPDRIVEVVSKQGNWARIKFNGGHGWCSLLYLRNVVHSVYREDTKIYKLNESINFRRSADWNAHILYVAPKNMLVDVIDDSGEWVSLWYANKIMYAPKSYMTYTGNIKPGSGQGPASPDNSIPQLTEEKEPIRPQVQYKNEFWIDIYNPDIPKFRFNTSELNMHMITKPDEILSMLKYEAIDNLNYDGDLISSYNTFDTTEIEIEFYIRKENYKYIIKKLKEIVRMPSFRLTLGWNRRFFRNARLADNIEIQEYLYDDIEAKIIMTFELQPYDYAQEGVHYVKDIKTGDTFLTHGSMIINNYEESYPKIYIPVPHETICKKDGNGEKTITISLHNYDRNETKYYKLKAHNYSYNGVPIDYVYAVIDSTTENVYEDTLDTNFNHLYKIENEFPVLHPGKTLISTSASFVDKQGNFLKFKIIPNWREL